MPSDKHIAEIVELYDKGHGDSIKDLAQTYALSVAAVTYHLKKAGVYAAVAKPGKTMSDAAAAQSDEDLGIGDDAPAIGGVDITALMANPDFAKLIDAMVEQRMQAAGVAPASPKSDQEMSYAAFLDSFKHLIDVQSEQRPGYIKPLSADEIDSRARGQQEMFALLAKFRAEDVWPEYLLTDEANPYYGPSPNGDVLYEAGQKIGSRRPPAEDWKPLNDAAIQVYAAYKRWVGDVIPVEDLIAQAAAVARGDNAAIAAETPTRAHVDNPDVRLINEPKVDVAPKRTLGTLTPELRGKSMPRQPGVMAQPVGPAFIADMA